MKIVEIKSKKIFFSYSCMIFRRMERKFYHFIQERERKKDKEMIIRALGL